MENPFNIIDLFAGPGGLGEGFSSLKTRGKPVFKIRMSVEKEVSAHNTLTLRALYRSLNSKKDRGIYHDFVAGRISKEDMIAALQDEWAAALEETLTTPSALGDDNQKIHKRLHELKAKHTGTPWVVIGGPPCQAYSLVGRSRNKGIKGYSAEADKRHFLYEEYLEVLNIIQPDIFVMENVKGILTASVGGERIFPRIRADLQHPTAAINGKATKSGKRYKIYSLVTAPDKNEELGSKYTADSSFIIRTENYGIPQARHRVILLGVSEDIDKEPELIKLQNPVNIEHVLIGLPPLRSKLSKSLDSPEDWSTAILKQAHKVFDESKPSSTLREVANHMLKISKHLKIDAPTVAHSYKSHSAISSKVPKQLRKWILNDRPISVLNHESRGHIPEDLGRYLFCSCWAQAYKGSGISIPKAEHFPKALTPKHLNWNSGHFADRFRVQAKGRPATTITSHISKDGHYFIHYDPTQCRSLTVREAARIQTFPDNYFFMGNRTQQYVQVGNAVPPFLARQIANVICKLLGH
jgi:DNA (cytosine-5)-methyltransferase 1